MEKKKRKLDPARELVFRRDSSDFKDVVKTLGFVDNTELLHIFLRHQKPIIELITAPPGFGKTTNLTMFRCFCEIEVDATGVLQTRRDPLTEPITDTDNYRLFVHKNLKVMKYEDTTNHLGRHPVVYADFECRVDMKSGEDVLRFCRGVAHDAFKSHHYLCCSEKLSACERKHCEEWCDPEIYQEKDPDEAFKELCILLYRHFERDVLFLVDGYDSIVLRGLVDSNERDFERICRKPFHMMWSVLRSDRNVKQIHLLGALVTGVSYIAGFGWSKSINYILPHLFSIRNEFTKFYGLQREQVDDLLSRLERVHNFRLDVKAREIIIDHYNGYEFVGDVRDSDKKVYCTWSVISYLQEGKVDWYWRNSCFIQPLKRMLSNHDIRKKLEALLVSNNVPLNLNLASLSPNDLKLLRQQIQTDVEKTNVDLCLGFLLELGFLTLDSNRPYSKYLKIPNVEIYILFLDTLREYYTDKCGLEFKNAVQAGEPFFDELSSIVKPHITDNCFKMAVDKFKNKLEEYTLYVENCLIGPDSINEPLLHCFVTYLITSVGFAYKPELYVPVTKGYLDVVGVKHHFGLLLRFKYVQLDCSARDVLKDIAKKKYVNIFKKLGIKHHIIMGVSIDDRNKMAISCIRNYDAEGNNTEHYIEYNSSL